jgi:hypothetical protein
MLKVARPEVAMLKKVGKPKLFYGYCMDTQGRLLQPPAAAIMKR